MKHVATLILTAACSVSLAARPAQAADVPAWLAVAGPTGGSVSSLALSPDYPRDHTAFAGVRGRGVYRTLDSGESWQLTSPADWNILDVAVSPAFAADRTVFVALGFWTSSYGVRRSTDGGATWQAPASPPYAYGFPPIDSLIVSPDFANDHTLYVIGASETYVSTDGGNTFTVAAGWFAAHQVTHLAFSPAYATDRTLFASAWDDRLYKSTDGGSLWNPTGLIGDVTAVAVSPGYAGDQTIAAILDDGSVHLSIDGGATWPLGGPTVQANGHHTLAFSPTYAQDRILLVASSLDAGAYRTTNGGATWSAVGWYNPAQSYLGGFIGGGVYDLVVAPGDATAPYAFAGTSSGIYRSLNQGEYWYQDKDGMPRLTVASLAVAPNDPSRLLAGSNFFETVNSYTPIEIDGNLQLSTDGGRSWKDVSGRIGQVHAVAWSPNAASDGTAFAAAGFSGQHGYSNGGLYRSVDGGQNWSLVKSGVWYAVAVSPDFDNDQTAWAASGSGVHVSVDGGGTWTLLASFTATMQIAPSPNFAEDDTLFAGSVNGLYRSINAGINWTLVMTRPVTALAVSPVYGASRTVYVGTKEGSAPGEIVRSTDGGATWQRLSTGIPALPGKPPPDIGRLAFAADGSVLAGVTYGSGDGGEVYRSSDGGETWQPLGGGLSARNVLSLASSSNRVDSVSSSDPSERGLNGAVSIFAGSEGGLWEFDLVPDGPAEAGQWSSGGPRGGKAQALAVLPNFASDGIAFGGEWMSGSAGSETGLGIFKSADGGQTWFASGAGAQSTLYSYHTAVHGFAFSPVFAADQTVYAATWGGLFRSTDGGAAWQWLPRAALSLPGSFVAVALSPNYVDSGHVIAANGWGGVTISRDAGDTWTTYVSVTTPSAVAYSPNFAADSTAFAAGFGVYKTIDGATSWTKVLSDSTSALVVSPNFGVDRTLFAGGDRLFKSTDGGATWISATVALTATRINALAISPQFAAAPTLWAGTNLGLYRSDDGGGAWNVVSSFPSVPVLSLAIAPNWPSQPVLLAGTARGVYRIADGGATWSLTQGFAPLATLPIRLSPDESQWVTGASNHGVYASADGSGRWSPIGLQDGSLLYSIRDVAISPAYASDHTLFAARKSDVSIGGGVVRTTDGGSTWQNVYNTDSVPSLAISPGYAVDRTIFAVGNMGRIQRSTNGGDNWSEVGTWPTGVGYPAIQVALPPNYPSDGTVFAAGSGWWRLPPAASTWVPASSGLLSTTNVIAFAVSPNYTASQTLLAVARWTTGLDNHFGVYRSTDGGANWQPSSIGLPDVELRDVAFSPDYATDRTAYLTTVSQAYRSIDGGLHWTAIGSPPGRPQLYRAAASHAGRLVVTTSAGVWEYRPVLHELLVDGDFEAGTGWDLPATPGSAHYAGDVVYTGRQAMHIGIDQGANALAYSSARQTVTIPLSATVALLSFRLYPVSGESQAAASSAVLSATAGRSPASGDAQYVLILDPANGSTLQTMVWALSNGQRWQSYTFDVSHYAVQTILLHFGTYNDGAGGRTAMRVDRVSLVASGWLPNRAYLPIISKHMSH